MRSPKRTLLLTLLAASANLGAAVITVEFSQPGYQLTYVQEDPNYPFWDPLAVTNVWGAFTGEDLNGDGAIRFTSIDYENNYPYSELYSFRLYAPQIPPWSQTPISYGFDLSNNTEPTSAELLRSFSFDLQTRALSYLADAPDPPAAGCNRAEYRNSVGYFEIDCVLQYTSEQAIEINRVTGVQDPPTISLIALAVFSLVTSLQLRRNQL